MPPVILQGNVKWRTSRIAILTLVGLLIIVLTACSSVVREGELIREEIGPKVRDEVSKRADQLADQFEKLEEDVAPPPEESACQSDNTRGSSAAPTENV